MVKENKTTALATRDIHALLDRKDVLAELQKAFPNALSAERHARIAITVIQKSESLMKCSPLSLLACVVESAQLGLEPDPSMGLIYFVPYAGVATIQIGWKGYAHLVFNTSDIYKIVPTVIRKGEKVSLTAGTRPELVHVPKDHGVEKPASKDEPSPESWTHAYSVATYRDGHTDFIVLERAEVFRRRAMSKAWREKKLGTPWFTNPESMWWKTAIRALANRLPKSTKDNRLARALAIDAAGDSDTPLLPAPGGGLGFDLIPQSVDEQIANETGDEPIRKSGEVKKGKKSKDEPIDVQPTKTETKKTAPPKNDPLVKDVSNRILNPAIASGWKADEVIAWIRKEFGVGITQVRESMMGKITHAMQSGTD